MTCTQLQHPGGLMKLSFIISTLLFSALAHAQPRMTDASKLEFNYERHYFHFVASIKEQGSTIKDKHQVWQNVIFDYQNTTSTMAKFEEIVGISKAFNIPLMIEASTQNTDLAESLKLAAIPTQIEINPQDLECHLESGLLSENPRIQIKYKGNVIVSNSLESMNKESSLESCQAEMSVQKAHAVAYVKFITANMASISATP